MYKFLYSFGRLLELIGIVITSLALLLFGKGGSMAGPMMTALIGGVWFILGWLLVKKSIKKLELK